MRRPSQAGTGPLEAQAFPSDYDAINGVVVSSKDKAGFRKHPNWRNGESVGNIAQGELFDARVVEPLCESLFGIVPGIAYPFTP